MKKYSAFVAVLCTLAAGIAFCEMEHGEMKLLASAKETTPTMAEHRFGTSDKALIISIEQIEITLDDLKESDYQVPVAIRLVSNPGVNAVEFGIECSAAYSIYNRQRDVASLTQLATAGDLIDDFLMVPDFYRGGLYPIEMTYKMSSVEPGLTWTTFACADPATDESGTMLVALVEVPSDVKAGDQIDLTYRKYGAGGASKHIWQMKENRITTDYISDDDLEAIDGYIRIIESDEGAKVESDTLGDANGDGELTVVDVVSVQKWLLNINSAQFVDWKLLDFNNDNEVDVFDLALMKRALLQENDEDSSPEPEKHELYHWVVDPQFDYDFAGPIKKDHTTYDTFTAEYLDDNTIWHGSLCVYGMDGRFGITDYTGAVLTPPEYNNIHVGIDENCILTDSEKLLSRKMFPDGTLTPFVSLDQNLEVTNGWDQVAWDEETNHIIGIYSFGELNESPIEAMPIYPVRKAIVRKYDGYQTYGIDWDGMYALAANDKLFSDFVFEKAGRYHEGIIPVKRDGKWGYVNKNGETVIPFEYDDAWERNRSMTINDENGHYADWAAYDATEGTVVLCQNGEYALYSTTGEEIIPFGVLEEISPLYEGKAWAKSDGLWGVIEVDGARK